MKESCTHNVNKRHYNDTKAKMKASTFSEVINSWCHLDLKGSSVELCLSCKMAEDSLAPPCSLQCE